MHTHRRSRSRVLGALAVLVAGAAALTACASGTTAGSSGAGSAVASTPSGASGSPSGGVTPGGPILSPSPSSPGSPGQSGAASPSKPAHGIPISGYSVKGTVLTVYFFGGVCDKYGVTADQSQSGQVRVTVVVTQHAPTGQMCPMVISQQHAAVDLGRPLDGRTVVDTSNGHAVTPQKTGLPMGAN